ncbi:hypothetical protein MYAM1_002609 [Malassezia yamatoensis]|uniref:UBX domain-containing protein n=1 Tax=Malassezia yamatoensis TaxID=253288 RepID=A0AAJ5YV43_9BASI|nr:hypothetical protein MYAM1_002609 [Malassezia yamatoensis]
MPPQDHRSFEAILSMGESMYEPGSDQRQGDTHASLNKSKDAGITVYRAPNSRAYALILAPPPADHDNFEPTPSELRAAFSSTIQQKHGPNAPLMTSAMRARQAEAHARSKKQYDTIKIRIRFSDRTQLEHTFPHTATIRDLYELVDQSLNEEGKGDYVLFQSPPKRDFPRAADSPTLSQLGFAPAAVLGIRWSDPRRNSMYSTDSDSLASQTPAPLRQDLATSAREVPLTPTYATQIPSVRQQHADDVNSDAQSARESRKFPKWFKPPGKR